MVIVFRRDEYTRGLLVAVKLEKDGLVLPLTNDFVSTYPDAFGALFFIFPTILS